MSAAIKYARPNRDSVTTIRDDGSRRFLYPADVHGRFSRLRRGSAFFLIAFYLSLPWIQIGGHPAVFLDIADRRFHLFGATLAFQDLWLVFFLITGVGFSLFFITSLLGRIWCGWACPQTVFLDHVYRVIERWIDGDAVKRRQLTAAPLRAGKIARRVAKHTLYILVSAVITHLFLAYYVSLPEVWRMVRADPAEHWGAFVFMTVATGVLYFNFAWFREQLCIIICPYGRLQSALVDDHSMVIGYDAKRGEPRGKLGIPDAGACIDCNRCVQVCPTGIDIRQGLQIECIGCAGCIDACDEVMDRLKRPRGLIRYDSLNGLSGGVTRWVRTRTIVYAAFFLLGASVFTWALSTVRPANMAVTRMVGAPYFTDAKFVRNQFLVRLVNKRNQPVRFLVTVKGAPSDVIVQGVAEPIMLGSLAEEVRPLIVQQSVENYRGGFHLQVVATESSSEYALEKNTEFIGPDPALLKMLKPGS